MDIEGAYVSKNIILYKMSIHEKIKDTLTSFSQKKQKELLELYDNIPELKEALSKNMLVHHHLSRKSVKCSGALSMMK